MCDLRVVFLTFFLIKRLTFLLDRFYKLFQLNYLSLFFVLCHHPIFHGIRDLTNFLYDFLGQHLFWKKVLEGFHDSGTMLVIRDSSLLEMSFRD